MCLCVCVVVCGRRKRFLSAGEVVVTCFDMLHILALFQHTSIERGKYRSLIKNCIHSADDTHKCMHVFMHRHAGSAGTKGRSFFDFS